MSVLSVVLPAYNESEVLFKTTEVLVEVLSKENIDFELVFVDDGSTDSTWEYIQKVCGGFYSVKGVHFSRNFGKEAAIFAGMEAADGLCVAVMDCDLQHPPETLIEMFRLWEEGYQVVEGVKRSRGRESRLHRACAGMFYRAISRAANVDLSGASDFKLFDRVAVDSLLKMPERNTFFRAMSSWIGYKSIAVEFDVQERQAGRSKWSARNLISYAISNIAGFSSAPMQLVTWTGIGTFILAVLIGIQTLVNYFSGGANEGFTTVILLLLIMCSIIMISLGIMGYYIARIYDEIKGRPRYIISEMIKSKENET